MLPRPCLTCKRLTRKGSYCEVHAPKPRPWAIPSASSQAIAADRAGWNRLRKLALKRDGHRCVVCGATEGLQVHHRVPIAAGGAHVLSNLIVLCRVHHRAAH
jgi:5-methylcytosine-specific restriction endonuclease McrA